MQVEFFFDCSSPWTYLAYSRIETVCSQAAAELIWRPILVGGVFNSVNRAVYEQRANPVPAKAAYYQKDLQDWARYQGIEIGSPSVFPVNSVKAMRGALVALERDAISLYAGAVFKAYWSDLRDISQEEVLRELVTEIGLDADDFSRKISEPFYKEKLRDNTDELIARGGFGSPTFFVDRDDFYFGNDRIPLLQARLQR
ncbi:MAG: 2-hydroxychromene-2-carboxylate isomerase [Pseudomonadales bacterium]|mgnify:CR=1|jgi:2-hydroxychromene-2-carboxylate isomerase|nr:2-hydroxychromene-2-carboxylate isomerase [Pseudomonadales bacterium]MDP7357696.1 2-hydroxychromene-2-carboxylate isomerase [Pseudomonadales bacterium]MDP7597135.1 2-hydroxychromene-2-carboxylate isomerase [Pseudomonadales bacterium]HJN48918.1 2-hydroxychromene-2-carboxylate isomerase [Pseudomonadales bacterium]|tara:strand:+ start:84 stop:680 length:597 start_codon:yes stop_codon:yes gene_type:complete